MRVRCSLSKASGLASVDVAGITFTKAGAEHELDLQALERLRLRATEKVQRTTPDGAVRVVAKDPKRYQPEPGDVELVELLDVVQVQPEDDPGITVPVRPRHVATETPFEAPSPPQAPVELAPAPAEPPAPTPPAADAPTAPTEAPPAAE